MSSRSREAFERVALPHLGALHALALRLTRDPRAAEDLVQDAVVKAFRFFHRFEPGTNGKAWLFKILVNLFYNQYQRDRRERRLVADLGGDAGEGATEAIAAWARPDAEAALLDRLTRDRIRAAVDALPDEFRVPVVLCDVEGLSYQEIADAMECPLGTVMSRLHRGRRALQGMLAAEAADAGIAVDLAEHRRRRQRGSS